MGALLFCSQKMVKNPYYIQNISTNIYSIEELCYYLCKNVYVIDQNIKSEMLCQWIEKELGMKKLAAKLRQFVLGHGTDSMFVGYILRSIKYCEEEQIKEIEEILEQLNHKSDHEKRKVRADHLLKNEKYRKALMEYRSIIDAPKEMNISKELYGNIYHNMGVVYGRLFLYEEAMECFQKACAILNDNEAYEAMVWCLFYLERFEDINSLIQIKNQRQDMVKELKKTKKYLQLQEIKELRVQGKIKEYEDTMTNLLEQLKNEYRKNTD